jgi:uncharacterized protein with von Willebrand factor type A (vWA) domain
MVESNKYLCESSIINIVGGYSYLEVQALSTLEEKPQKANAQSINPNEKEIAIVIDKSGSMSGAYIKNTKLLVNKLVQHLWEQKMRNIYIIAFNHENDVLNVKEVKDSQDIEKFISNITASGGTLFTRVFMKIKEHLDKYLKTEKVIFLFFKNKV